MPATKADWLWAIACACTWAACVAVSSLKGC